MPGRLTDFEYGANVRKRDRFGEWARYKQKAYARACEIRNNLRQALGNCCWRCGGTGGNLPLHFDHGEYVRTWEPKWMNLLARMKQYEKDYKAGLLAGLLCCACSGYDGAKFGKQRRIAKYREEPKSCA